MAVGNLIGKLTAFIQGKASQLKAFCIGHSLGAHVCGFAGKEYTKMSGIIGLDPARPIFNTNSRENRLNRNDAEAVHIIHGGTNFKGMRFPIGHVDFYVDGGVHKHHYVNGLFRYMTAARKDDVDRTDICTTNIVCPITNPSEINDVDFSKFPSERSSLSLSSNIKGGKVNSI